MPVPCTSFISFYPPSSPANALLSLFRHHLAEEEKPKVRLLQTGQWGPTPYPPCLPQLLGH